MTTIETGSNQPEAVKEFIVECVESAGGATEPRGSALLDALLPGDLEFAAGDRSIVTLALSPDSMRYDPAAEPASIGSPFVDNLIAYASKRGTTSYGRLDSGILKSKGLKQILEREILFSNCRVRFDDSSIRFSDMHYAVFEFRLTYVSDERRERLFTTPIDLWSNQPNTRLSELFPTLNILRIDGFDENRAAGGAVRTAYELAKKIVRERAIADSKVYQARLLQRYEVEHGRIAGYYRQIELDLLRRASLEHDKVKQEAIIHKITAVKAEAGGKLHELADKYRIRPKATLVNASLLAQKKTFFQVLIDRGSITRTLELTYDSLLERLDLPSCEQCSRPTTRIDVTNSAQRLCRACSGRE